MFDFASRITPKERVLLRAAFFWRLLRKQIRLRAQNRMLARRLARIEGEHRREVERLNRLVEARERQYIVELQESRDRLLELAGTHPIRFAQTTEEGVVRTLKEQKYPKPPEPPRRERLSHEQQQLYDVRYANHVKFCHEEGIRDEQQIRDLWRQHEDEEIQQINVEFLQVQPNE